MFQLLSGPNEPETEVTVPNFVGRLIEDATREADDLGITLVQTPDPESDQPAGTILSQDPLAETAVLAGSEVAVTVAAGLTQIPTPDLRNKTEAQAVTDLVAAGLRPGVRTEAFDPTVAPGLIISQNPAPGVIVARDAAIDYVISTGPEPTPSPTPSPTPTPEPTPSPTPEPTPSPTPEPTPSPTPEPTATETPTEAPTPTPAP